jgi:small subunit ribosomal protein S20
MATAVFGSAHRAAPDQPRGYAEIRRFLGTVAATEEPRHPLTGLCLEEADPPGRSCLMLTRVGVCRTRFWPHRPGLPVRSNDSPSEFPVDEIRNPSNVGALFIRSMANTRSAAKRARQTQVRMLRNRRVLTEIKSQQKKLRAAIGAGDEKQAALEFAALSSRLDKASRRGVIHKNFANRKKSRASRKLVAAKAPKAGAA